MPPYNCTNLILQEWPLNGRPVVIRCVRLVSGRTEIAQFDEASMIKENIFDFYVAVNNSQHVNSLQCKAKLIRYSM